MTIEKITRTRETFKDKISNQSPSSIEGILQAIDNFECFCMEKHGKVDLTPDMKELDDEELYDLLQSWLNWNNSKAPRTMIVYFSRLKKYLHYMGIKLNEQDIKAELDFKHHVDEELYGLSLNDIKTILAEFQYKHKVQFMCQLSSCMRIGEIVQLRKKHLILDKGNIIVKIPSKIAKNSKGRTTYFSKESSKLLRPLLKKLNDDDLIFGSSENKINAKSNSEQILRRVLRKTGLTMKYESTGRFMINTHSFRAYGITKLSRHDENFSKKISGQKGYLLMYDRLSDDEKLELYQKYEIDLIIDDSAKLKAEQNLLVGDHTKKDKQIEDLQLALKGKEELVMALDIIKMRLKHADERMAIIESELPNFQITRIRKSTNPKVLDANTKFYV